jgi:hypothetical protein
MSHVSLVRQSKKVASPNEGFSSVGRIDAMLSATGKELTTEKGYWELLGIKNAA